MICVDRPRALLRGGIPCTRLFEDQLDYEALHKFAESIGLPRRAFNAASAVGVGIYTLWGGKFRQKALAAGAREVPDAILVDLMRRSARLCPRCLRTYCNCRGSR